MSRETMEWLNLNTLIGYTDKRGNAWHYRQELQGIESNHYVGGVPVGDVLRRLFNFEVIESPMFMRSASGAYVEVPGRKLMVRDDNDIVLGVFESGYTGHQCRAFVSIPDNASSLMTNWGSVVPVCSAWVRRRGSASRFPRTSSPPRVSSSGPTFSQPRHSTGRSPQP